MADRNGVYNEKGEFVPIFRIGEPRKIVCYPVPGDGVVNWEPDWFDIPINQ